MEGGLEMTAYGLENGRDRSRDESAAPQKGSMLLETIIVLGMVATFTPLLYKHVADRRADIENINRANTLLYLQQRTEEYLKKPENITDLIEELGHNQHKEIYPSELGIGNNFDGRYIIGIRREDENNQPVLKAMIIDTVNTGSDLRAAKVAELIGVSAGIYTAVDPDAAWGINGLWSEPLERYFNNTNIPTGTVAVTTEYNKEKYRVSISDILVDADLDLGEFDLTAEDIHAINIAAENGTIGELIAQNKVKAPKFVATGNFCFEKDGVEQCIDSWEGLGGGGGEQKSDLQLVQECNAGITDSCMAAFFRGLNKSCSDVDAVYDQADTPYPSPKIYRLTYGNGGEYAGEIRTKCEGTSFVADNINTSSLSSPVEMIGGSAFSITQPGWYQITLRGEEGRSDIDGYRDKKGAGGILVANKYYNVGALLTLRGIKGGMYDSVRFGGAGIAFWDSITNVPTLVAGGGGGYGNSGGGGYTGGDASNSNSFSPLPGYGWNENSGGNSSCCLTATCNEGASGGCLYSASNSYGKGGTGTGSSGHPCPTGYTCTTISGGTALSSGTPAYPASFYGNWSASSHSEASGYASIVYCGSSQSDCPATCTQSSDCSGATPYCQNAICTMSPCSSDSDCSEAAPYCTSYGCSAFPQAGATVFEIKNIAAGTGNGCAPTFSSRSYTIVTPGKYKISLYGESGWCGWGDNYGCGGAGGILKVAKLFDVSTVITIQGIYGNCEDEYELVWGGTGVMMKENNVARMVAGGGGGEFTGGGWSGPCLYCPSTSCSDESYGGRSGSTCGGRGYCDPGYCNSSNYYEIIPGGNWGGWSSPNDIYPRSSHGNWINTPLTGGKGYAKVVYCGPDANSNCPAD